MTVSLDYSTLNSLRSHHPAWRLLRSDHAPLIASFLHRIFIVPNQRVMAAADLAEALEDGLYHLRQQLGDKAFPRAAMAYLNEWAEPDKGWLRKFYRQESDEPQFDLTPATEKALAWLTSLTERSFVGTESRLLTLFELLKQIDQGSEQDPARRLQELKKQRAELDVELARAEAGELALLDETALKDRFQQFLQIARELLTDFREVEHNFRQLDRHVREQIALWDDSKGELLGQIMGARDAISDSDQGKSFRAFWDFLMSSHRQEELSALLERVLMLTAVQELKPDVRTRRIHYDWLEAGEHTQRTVAQLSQQLRRFLDDQAWLENWRIMDILRAIETKALTLRQTAPEGEFSTIAATAASVELPMERPLFTPPLKPLLQSLHLQTGDQNIDPSLLYNQMVIDKNRLLRHIRHSLQQRSQITLGQLIALQPLQYGLAELIVYLQLGNSFNMVIDDQASEDICWQTCTVEGQNITRQARMPQVIFVR